MMRTACDVLLMHGAVASTLDSIVTALRLGKRQDAEHSGSVTPSLRFD